jgi:hypothetical protein
MFFINMDIYLKVYLYHWSMGTNNFWQSKFLKFMTALFINCSKM